MSRLFDVLLSPTMSRRGGGGFGLSASRISRGSFRGNGRGTSSWRGGRGRGAHTASSANAVVAVPKKDEEGTHLAERFEQIRISDEVDEKLGFARVQEGPRREGWLVNMRPVSKPHGCISALAHREFL